MLRRGFEKGWLLALDHGVGGIPAHLVIVATGAHEAINLCPFDFGVITGPGRLVVTDQCTEQGKGQQGQQRTGATHDIGMDVCQSYRSKLHCPELHCPELK